MSQANENDHYPWLTYLTKCLEVLLIIGIAALVADVLYGVFSRYVLGAQGRWTEELAIYLLVWISLLGAALTYSENGHLGVDYFVEKLDVSARRITAYIVDVLVFAFSLFSMVIGGWTLVTETLATKQLSPALGVPVGFLYIAVPLSGLFFCLFAVVHIVERKKSSTSVPDER